MREVDQCVVPSRCSSCALVLFIGSPSLKTPALVSKMQGNAYMSEMQIRNDGPALLQLHLVGCFLQLGPLQPVHCVGVIRG